MLVALTGKPVSRPRSAVGSGFPCLPSDSIARSSPSQLQTLHRQAKAQSALWPEQGGCGRRLHGVASFFASSTPSPRLSGSNATLIQRFNIPRDIPPRPGRPKAEQKASSFPSGKRSFNPLRGGASAATRSGLRTVQAVRAQFQSPQRRGKRCNEAMCLCRGVRCSLRFNPLRGGASAATVRKSAFKRSGICHVSIPSEAGQALQRGMSKDRVLCAGMGFNPLRGGASAATDTRAPLSQRAHTARFNPLRGGASAATVEESGLGRLRDGRFQSPQRRGKRCNS